MILDTTAKIVRYKLGEAHTTSALVVTADYADTASGSTFVPGSQGSDSNGTADVTAVSAPAASTQRHIKTLAFTNSDTVTHTLTVQQYDGVTARTLVAVSLLTNETLTWGADFGWRIGTGAGGGTGGGSLPATTDALAEGVVNLYFTNERAQDAVGAMVDSTLAYVDATPLLTRAALTGDVTAPQASNATTLATVNANVGIFGSVTQTIQVTYNGKGLATAVANVTIAIPSTQVTDFNEAAQDATGAMVGVSLIYADATPLLARAALTGDITAPQDSNATTLATVNANVGSFGLAASVPQFTVNAKGLMTAAANVAIAIPSTQVTDFNEAAQDATGAMVDATLVYVDATPLLTRAALTGDITAPQASNATTLATVNANVGSFGSTTQVMAQTVNGKGLTTAASNITIAIPSTQVTDFAEATDDRVAALVQNGTGLTWTYSDAGGTFTGNVSLSAFSTTNLAEGTNLYYTNARADARIAAAVGVTVQAQDADLDAVAALTGTGLAVRTAANTWALRTLQAPAKGFTITSPAGSGGDPTFVLADDLAGLENITGTGVTVRDAIGSFVTRTLAGTSNEITVTNGDGMAGAPTFSLSATLDLSGHAATVQDNNFTIQDNVNTTRKAVFQASGISNSTTRTFSFPNQDGTFALLSDITGTFQPLDADLTALAAITGTGIAARTASNTWALRTWQAPSAGITISNPGGVAGNMTIGLADDLAGLENISGTGFGVRTAINTWATRSLVAGTGITIDDPDGSSGDITISSSAPDVSVVTSNFDKTDSTTLSNIPGLSAVLAAGETYTFRGVFPFHNDFQTPSGAGAPGGGIKFAVAGTTAETWILFTISFSRESVSSPNYMLVSKTALGDNTGLLTGSIFEGVCIIEGTIKVAGGGGGTLVPQFALNTVGSGTGASATSTVKRGSSWTVTRIS